MNSQLLFNTDILLMGQPAPCTSTTANTFRAHELAFIVFASGVSGLATINYSFKSPFFGDDVTFYSQTISGNGYAPIPYMQTPVSNIKATITGTGNFWLAVNYQN